MAQIVVADTSALVVIFRAETNALQVSQVLNSANLVVIPASCLVEAALLRQVGRGFFGWVQELMLRDNFELGPISAPIAEIAAAAARKYGRGSGHPARLNFGDCLSFAVAEYRDLPLLYVGDGFSQTPIKSALATFRN